jgi:hypothetical protein
MKRKPPVARLLSSPAAYHKCPLIHGKAHSRPSKRTSRPVTVACSTRCEPSGAPKIDPAIFISQMLLVQPDASRRVPLCPVCSLYSVATCVSLAAAFCFASLHGRGASSTMGKEPVDKTGYILDRSGPTDGFVPKFKVPALGIAEQTCRHQAQRLQLPRCAGFTASGRDDRADATGNYLQ